MNSRSKTLGRGHMRTQARFLIYLIALGSLATGAEKPRTWETGKVLDTERNRYFAGTYNSGSSSGTVNASGTTIGNNTTVNGTYQGQSSGSPVAIYKTYATYVIESDKYVYQAEERLHWRWSKAASLIVNGPVKFAVEKHTLYLIDEDGKEHEAKIVKQVLKQ